MPEEDNTLTLTLHGLQAFNKDVDAEVFARKFFKFMQGLAEADKAANGSRSSKFLIEGLEKNTATATVREQVLAQAQKHVFATSYLESALSDIYYDNPSARALPEKIVKYAKDLSSDVGKTFQFGEVKRGRMTTIRIDDGFRRNASRIISEIQRATLGKVEPFTGKAFISLDGVVETLDSRTEQETAIIRLTAGGFEIKCNVASIKDEDLREIWKRRCTVQGVGHYSGNSKLPDWVDAKRVEAVPTGEGWQSWAGAFPHLNADEWAN